jgi:hypothetical protein
MSRVIFVVPLCAWALTACPIDDVRDGIGLPCSIAGKACPFDYTCVPDDKDAPDEGVCAPIADYGQECPPPTYPVRDQKVLDDDVVIDDSADFLRTKDVATVHGGLEVRSPGAGGVFLLGDDALCPLAGLQHTDGALIVGETNAPTLDGLQNFAYAGGGIVVHSNPNLTDVRGLQNVVLAEEPDGQNIALINNAALDADAIAELREALAETSPTLQIRDCGNRDSSERDCGTLLNSLLPGGE